MSNTYDVEFTDTYCGEANYCWVVRKTVSMPELTHYGYTGSCDGSYAKARKAFERELVKRAKAALNLTGVRCNRESWGDTIKLTPRNTATAVFITFQESQ